MMVVQIKKSTRADKKWMAIFEDGKVVHFGASGYEDYTTHHDVERKKRYENRHKAKEHWNDYKTPGFWAKNLLWNKPSIAASIKDIEKNFPLQIIKK